MYNPDIIKAVREGLLKKDKRLPSWLLYDEVGDKLFERIMNMPEYYLTGCEHAIFQAQKESICDLFCADTAPFDLVELGAGNGVKTRVLLEHLIARNAAFTYVPVDVSQKALQGLTKTLAQELPTLDVKAKSRLYEEALKELSSDGKKKKVLFFLGANIGNFSRDEAASFVGMLAASMSSQDFLLIGFDLKKDPRLIQSAYDDEKGITRSFNLNVLERINRDLGGHFVVSHFEHYPFYQPETGTAKSYLISRCEQETPIEALNTSFHFDQWEAINTETSQKYDVAMIERLAHRSGLRVVDFFYDPKRYFCDVVMQLA